MIGRAVVCAVATVLAAVSSAPAGAAVDVPAGRANDAAVTVAAAGVPLADARSRTLPDLPVEGGMGTVGHRVPAPAGRAATPDETDAGATTAAPDVTDDSEPPGAPDTPAVGTVRQWLGLDDARGRLYRKNFTLRAVGTHVEVWVADDVAFPAGDCRSRVAGGTDITDAQIEAFVTAFDGTIQPTEAAVFSTPPDRDGSRARLGPDAHGDGGDYAGAGGRTVTLVDNIRDADYYAFPSAPTFIAGFFSAQLGELFDRNVLTVDAYDWAHRTGSAPPDEPTDEVCTSRPAYPRSYESTVAHEWQHLLQAAVDPHEEVWLDEGLSEVAQSLTGYVDAHASVGQPGAESHLFCSRVSGRYPGPGTLFRGTAAAPRTR